MKPWQKMLLITLSLAISASILGLHLPDTNDRFAFTVGMASAIVLIGMFVMRPPENKA